MRLTTFKAHKEFLRQTYSVKFDYLYILYCHCSSICTTKTCSNCGSTREIRLSEREYECPVCGHSMNRDLNSAINMLRFVGLERFEVKPEEVTQQ
ncbi:zinc ribbon domain-containing protein [Pseudothermotoga sp. U03pept]|uniref:zinc ribbon domain-containing protein n=1 Tax=Pseudothermotoga sp. U03pept TaxID=3447012 RepID=UPI003F05957A